MKLCIVYKADYIVVVQNHLVSGVLHGTQHVFLLIRLL